MQASGLRSQNSMRRITNKEVKNDDISVKQKKYRTITPNEGIRNKQHNEYSTLNFAEATGILNTIDGDVSQITK